MGNADDNQSTDSLNDNRRSSRSKRKGTLDNGSNNSPRKKGRKSKSALVSEEINAAAATSTKTTVEQSSSSSSSELDSFVEKARKDVIKSLASSSEVTNGNFKSTLERVKSLIKENREVLDRCDGYCISKDQGRSDIKMLGIGFDSIKIEDDRGDAIATTVPKYYIKLFDSFPTLPRELGDIFPLSSNGGALPDFDRYLKNVLLLDNGVLGAFLPRLQSYLESLQTFLGGVEEWINEAMESRIFLEELFGKDMNLGKLDLSEYENFHCGTVWQGETITLLTLDETKTMNISFDITCKRERERAKAYIEFLQL